MFKRKSLHKCRFNDSHCLKKPRLFGCICGLDDDSDPGPPPKDSAEIAREQVAAQVESIPRAAQLNFDVLSNPDYGLQASTQLLEDTRANVFPQLTQGREQLVQQLIAGLTSGTGISPEQQTAIDQRRGQAQDETVEALRTRANLGGGLFGGRSGRTEERAVSDLQARFSEEDVNRQIAQRQFNQQLLLSVIQSFLPGAQITPPQFINPVQSPESASSANVTGRGQDLSFQAQQDASRAALYSSLFQTLGKAAGAAAGASGGGAG